MVTIKTLFLKNYIEVQQQTYPILFNTPFSVIYEFLIDKNLYIEDGVVKVSLLKYNKDLEKYDVLEHRKFEDYYRTKNINLGLDGIDSSNNSSEHIAIDMKNINIQELFKYQYFMDFINKEKLNTHFDINTKDFIYKKFNKNTNKVILRVTIAFLKALVKHLENLKQLPKDKLWYKTDDTFKLIEYQLEGKITEEVEYNNLLKSFEYIDEIKEDINLLESFILD